MRWFLPLAFVLAVIACGDEEETEVEIEVDRLIPAQIFGVQDYGDKGVAVLLKGQEHLLVPIVVGHFEAQALVGAIQKKEFPRPLPYDLLQALLERMQGRVRQLVIHSIRDDVFYAYLVIQTDGESFSLDCRPSDGMVMATRLGAPIYLTPGVVEQMEPKSKV